MVNETYKYRRPRFKHNVTTTLKKQFKQEGLYTEEKDVQFIDGKYVAVPIVSPQISVYDLEEVE